MTSLIVGSNSASTRMGDRAAAVYDLVNSGVEQRYALVNTAASAVYDLVNSGVEQPNRLIMILPVLAVYDLVNSGVEQHPDRAGQFYLRCV